MTDHARRAVVVAAPLLAWLAIQPFAAQLPVGVVLPLALLVTAVLPGLAIARRVGTGLRSEERFALAALLSPALVSAVSLVTRSLGGTERLAVTIVVAMIAFVSLAPASAPSAPGASREARRAVWPFVLAALLAAAHLASAALAWRSDGAFHAGVVHAFARGVSPEDPFLAGLPLRYFWGWHGWAACVLATVPQIPATLLLASSSVLAFAAALVGVSSLAASLGAEARARGWAIVLLLVGAAPFAWLTLAGHALVGETRGLAELEPVLAHGGDLALRSLDPGFLHPSLVLPLDKFVVVTPFAWGLAGAFVLVRVLADALAQANVRAWSAVALTSAAIVFLHPAAGLLLVVASAVALLALAAAGRVTWRAAGFALVACALGALAALPYLAHLAPAGGGGATALRFGLDARGALSVVWGGLVLLPLAWLALRRADSTPGALVGVQLAVLLVPALILRAGGDNQSKALNLAFALAAAPAAIALATWAATRARRIAALGLAILAWAPALAAMLFAYAHEGPASADAPGSPGAAMLQAVAREVPVTGVVVDATLAPTRDAAPMLPGATGRALLWSGAFMAGKWGHPEAALAAREEAATTLAEGRWPRGDAGVMLEALAREVWVIVPDDAAHAWASPIATARADGRLLVRMTPP